MTTMVIIGGGQAGSQAIDTLRREGFAGRLVLIGEEPWLPYQRPPLSKKYLAGEFALERLPFRHRAFYDEHRVELRLGRRAERLEAAERRVTLDDGEIIAYDRLLLCLGAEPRRLACPGAQLSGVHALRSIADVERIRPDLRPGARLVVVGGGYIGLETAATARQMGCEVTVLETADRLMNRVVAPETSAYFAAEHGRHGISIVCGARVERFEGSARVDGVVCAGGERHPADAVIVGVGALPVTRLAQDAGLACDNGITVDEYCATSDPAIFAAGDCANHPSPHYGVRVRLESVDNAFEQAKAAALNMLDRRTVHDRVPWFWSDQFDNKLLICGLSQGHDRRVLRGEPAGRAFSVCYLRNGELIALEAVNHGKDYMAARKLILGRLRPDLGRLADPGIELRDL